MLQNPSKAIREAIRLFDAENVTESDWDLFDSPMTDEEIERATS